MMTQKIKFGNNVLSELSKFLQNLNPKKILLVIGKKSFSKSGAKSKIEPLLSKYEYCKFYNHTSYNNIENIIEGIELIKLNKIDLIIAVGGGGVIDKSKIINILSNTSNNNLVKIITLGLYNISKIPMIAIPTTAGTGSESTKFATLYINKIKYSIEDESLIPIIAIIDPVLIKSNSSYTMLSAGLDALSQSIESYWSINSNLTSKKYALEAMEKIWHILPKIANKTISEKEIESLSWAANLSGRAINISKTTASHAISYYLTSNYGIAHGHAVMLTLGNVFKLNIEISKDNLNEQRGLKYCKNNLKTICDTLKIDKDDVREVFSNYLKKLSLNTKLNEFNINKNDLESIAKNINLKRIKNNPRLLSEDDISFILNEIY